MARYIINPPLTLILAAALGLVALALSTLIFVPPDTLAAWLPVPTLAIESDIASIPTINSTQLPAPAIRSFTSESDTILLQAPQSFGASSIALAPPIESAAVESSAAVLPPAPPAGTGLVPIEPSLLIGPELPITSVSRSQLAHQPTYPGEKWIEVNATTQQVTAWEGDTPVMSFVVSTGLPQTPTVLGEFNIYWKLESTTMSGSGYYLPDVPYTMYFYEGYALHGTYWHSNFGQPMSRGCVNLPTDNAKQLFEWAGPVIPPGQTVVEATHENPGTLVVVHE